SLVNKMLVCGDPERMGYIASRCLHCGEGTHQVAMSCQSSLCLRCAKVYVDNWVSQVSRMLHAGVIYRHIVLTVPELLRKTFYQQSQAVLSPFMRCGVRCLVIAQPGSNKERTGERAFWMAWYADRPWRLPVLTIERTAANRSRPQS